jgi:hypothetical protein
VGDLHIHNGESYPEPSQMLYKIMHGRKLWVNYVSAGGETREIGFDLRGSKAAIHLALY